MKVFVFCDLSGNLIDETKGDVNGERVTTD